jgi:dTDP-4-dehydrorhamnose 3,5-epimerase
MPIILVRPNRFGDARGWFSETYSRERYAALGIDCLFVQDNHSMSREPGVLRGLHWQAPPHGQAKLVRCVRGAIWDVAVDARRGSPTFGRWVSAELTADNGHQLFVPVGFAHGFVTLAPDSEVEYKVSASYAPASEGGVLWNDPDLALPWPLPAGGPILSPKDEILPRLSEAASPFDYDGRPLELIEA